MKTIIVLLCCLIVCFSGFCQQVNRYIQSGNKAYRSNNFSEAVVQYQKALQLDQLNNIARFNMANTLQKQHDAAAEAKYDELAASLKETSLKSFSYYNKALALAKEKKLPATIEAFKQSLLLNPDDNEARDNLQRAMNELKKQQQSQPQQKEQNKPQRNPSQPKINKDMMEQKFKELQNQEKKIQQKLQKKQNNGQPEKDW